MITKNITAFAVNKINGQVAVTYSYDEIDENGKVIKANIRDRRFIVASVAKNINTLNSIDEIENYIKTIITNEI